MIYTTGTVNTVSGSAIVKGTGTKFKNNNPAINIGMTILIKSGNTNIPYMIKSVNSDTELVLAQPALATATNTTFSIHITEPDNNSDAARTMVAINSYAQYFLDAMNTWMSETGQTKIEMPNGEVITLDSIKKMQEDISNKADLKLSKTQSFTSAIEATTKLTSKSADGKTSISLSTNNSGSTNIELNSSSGYNGIQIPKASGVIMLVGDYGVGLNAKTGTTQAESTNANNLDTNGFWASGGSSSANFYNPFGSLISSARGGGSDGTGQVFQIQASSKNLAYRMRNVGNWTYWSELMNVNSDGVKSSKNDFKNNGFYTSTNIDGEIMGTVYMGIVSAHATQPESYQIGLFGRNKKLLYTYKESGNWVGTYEVLHLGNAKPDSNGFYKKASPIIDINPDGTFTTNDESEGAIVTRVGQGEYLIEGVLGFNSDAGWGGIDGGIEIPLDVNKQPLIWVDSIVNEDGSILVKTYHRTHPNAPKFARNDIDGFNDGDPIDIPDGRFISVRVQMPEQSIYNVRMREMEEAQKAEEECIVKEEVEE
ncbi:hypothetical protein [Proteus sp. TSJ240517]|uniref:phage tail fiber protein n=1 Tax=Proteus sp. TSJ240517 TaxID=3399622 RepID=UPI003A4E40F7